MRSARRPSRTPIQKAFRGNDQGIGSLFLKNRKTAEEPFPPTYFCTKNRQRAPSAAVVSPKKSLRADHIHPYRRRCGVVIHSIAYDQSK